MKNYKAMNTQNENKIKAITYNFDTSALKMFWTIILAMLFVTIANNLSAQCETINLTCNDQINISINEDCYASINVDLLLENPPLDVYPDDGANYELTLFDKYGAPIVPSNQVDQEYVGQIIKAKIELLPCGIACWSTVFVEDKIGPKIWGCVNGALPTLQIDCDEFSDGFLIEPPVLGSVCPEIDVLTFVDDTTSLNCNEEFAFNIFRVWTASDDYENTTSCTQTVQIRKYNLSDVVIPDDFIVEIDQNKDCSFYLDISPEKTGYPSGIHCLNIMHSYTDINYPQCGLQIKLLRDWFVIDWCTGQSLTKGQIIKYSDRSAPRVEINIDTLVVGNGPYACGAIPILNPFRVLEFDTLGAFTVLDTCQDKITLKVGFLTAQPGVEQPVNVPYYTIEQEENGTYVLPEIEDVAWIRYCFEDECGNATRIPTDPDDAGEEGFCHYFKIKSKDVHPPTAICEGFTKVPLGIDGITEVFATTFNDSSYDPCGAISRFEVKRENYSCPGYDEHELDEFGESIHFCCQDLGDTITIRLRVFDMAGNYSECLSLVCVSDPRTPIVTCPDSNIELDCGDDYTDHALIGLPSGIDGCDAGIRIGDERFNLGSFNIECGVGTILRTIDVTDVNNKPLKTCTQTILFDAGVISATLEDGDYTFPDDLTLDICTSGGSLDPIYTGIPFTLKEFGCANVEYVYEDDGPIVSNTDGICYRILRTWKVIDWCNYNPSNPDQYSLTAVQEIKITDSSIPLFNCPNDLTVVAPTGECEAEVSLILGVSSTCASNFDITWTIDAFSDGTIDYAGNGNDASDVYPAGEHTIIFTGGNQCGGTTKTCTYTFKVTSDAAPLPICLANVIWSLGSTSTTEIWASDFDVKSEGGCGLDDLIFSFVDVDASNFPVTAETYDCSDLPNGQYVDLTVSIYIVDESGRSASCTSILQLQDTQDLCPDSANMASVTGGVKTETNEPLEEIMVSLENMDTESSVMEMTNQNGGFSFENIAMGNNYNIKPTHDEDHLNGISTLDLVMLQRHILGLNSIDSPYKLIAGDIDNSGNISAIDLIQLRKLILGVYDELPENDSWTFVPSSHKFVDVFQPWDYPKYAHIDDMSEDMESNFVAVKVGDVNNSVDLDYGKGISSRSNTSVFLQTGNAKYVSNELIAVPLIIEKTQDIYGMQFSFDFDDTSMLFEGIDNGVMEVSQDNFSLSNKEDGVLTFSFSNANGISLEGGQTLFTIYFESRGNVNLSNDIQINSSVTQAEIYNVDNTISNLELVVVNENVINSEMEVYQNEPNPFDDYTRITFSISERQNVSVTIFDATGKVLIKKTKEFGKGLSEFIINANELDAEGLLLYRVESESSSITKKMIMVK